MELFLPKVNARNGLTYMYIESANYSFHFYILCDVDYNLVNVPIKSPVSEPLSIRKEIHDITKSVFGIDNCDLRFVCLELFLAHPKYIMIENDSFVLNKNGKNFKHTMDWEHARIVSSELYYYVDRLHNANRSATQIMFYNSQNVYKYATPDEFKKVIKKIIDSYTDSEYMRRILWIIAEVNKSSPPSQQEINARFQSFLNIMMS
jgi:hypothetical protein